MFHRPLYDDKLDFIEGLPRGIPQVQRSVLMRMLVDIPLVILSVVVVAIVMVFMRSEPVTLDDDEDVYSPY